MGARAVTIALIAGAMGIGLLAFNFLQSDEPAGGPDVRQSAGDEDASAVAQGQSAGADARPPPAPSANTSPAQPGSASPSPGVDPSGSPVAAPERPGSQAAGSQASRSTSQRPSSAEPSDAEKIFTAEVVDPAWAAGMEATLYEQVGEIAGSEIVTVHTECKTTLCRLQVTQRVPVQAGRSADESPAMYEMYEKLFARLGFENRAITSTSDGNGLVTSVVYLPRGDLDEPATAP